MAGRLRTCSRPSRTVIDDAPSSCACVVTRFSLFETCFCNALLIISSLCCRAAGLVALDGDFTHGAFEFFRLAERFMRGSCGRKSTDVLLINRGFALRPPTFDIK